MIDVLDNDDQISSDVKRIVPLDPRGLCLNTVVLATPELWTTSKQQTACVLFCYNRKERKISLGFDGDFIDIFFVVSG